MSFMAGFLVHDRLPASAGRLLPGFCRPATGGFDTGAGVAEKKYSGMSNSGVAGTTKVDVSGRIGRAEGIR